MRTRLAVTALTLTLGCAGTAEVRPAPGATPAPTRAEPPPPPRAPDPRFADFHLQCRDQLAPCPAAVGMLVRPSGEDVERCTAALVAPDRVVTASHCLPQPARTPGAACDGAWVLFGRTESRPQEWHACAEVVRADHVGDERVMRQDVAMVRLATPSSRPTLPVLAAPPDEGSVVTVLSARRHPIYPHHNEVVVRLCRVAEQDSAVETFGREAARVGWLMDCPSYPGNSGSPVLDARGRLRSLMHAGSAPQHGVAVTSGLQ